MDYVFLWFRPTSYIFALSSSFNIGSRSKYDLGGYIIFYFQLCIFFRCR